MADEGVRFFPLYCVLDEKFELLEAEYGLKGFAIVVKLFQRIYKEHGYYCEWSNDIALIFAKQCGLSNIGGQYNDNNNNGVSLGTAAGTSVSGQTKNLIAQVVSASIRRGIFDKRLFEEYSILTSRGIQRNFLSIVRNRKKVEIKKQYLLLSDAEIKGNVVITDNSYVRNSNSYVSFKQSKVKESKVKYKDRERARATDTVERFEEFLSAYPKYCNRYLTEHEYVSLLLTGKITEKELIQCAQNYAEWCKMEDLDERYIKNAENFLKETVFEKYMLGNYKKPTPKADNKFNRFEQQDYDISELEKDILSN